MSNAPSHGPTELRDGQFESALNHLKSLIASRSFSKEKLLDKNVRADIEFVLEGILTSKSKFAKLEGVALLGKACELSKPIAREIQPKLKLALRIALPEVDDWGSAEDRYYLAKGISIGDAEWIVGYAARELARGDVLERTSRIVWARLGVERAESLSELVNKVADALSKKSQIPDQRGGTIARKLNRIIEAFEQSILTADIPLGSHLGKSLLILSREFSTINSADARKLRAESADILLNFVIQLLRLRFQLLFNSDIYKIVGNVRNWWRPARPPVEVESKVDRIAYLALEGLMVLARQGVFDLELRRTVVSAVGVDRVTEITRRITDKEMSASPAVVHWLSTGRELQPHKPSSEVSQLASQGEDELLGHLLLAMQNEEASPQALRVLASAIEVLEPGYANQARAVATRGEMTEQWVRELARGRQLEVFGTKGETTEFDPTLHESAKVLKRFGLVRVKNPGVLKRVGASPLVLMKAIVEAA